MLGREFSAKASSSVAIARGALVRGARRSAALPARMGVTLVCVSLALGVMACAHEARGAGATGEGMGVAQAGSNGTGGASTSATGVTEKPLSVTKPGEAKRPRDVQTLLTSGGDESEWAAAPAGTLATLTGTARDSNALIDTRLHAVQGLAWIPENGATEALRAIIAEASMTPEVRSEAVTSLARRLGRDAVPELQKLLEDADPNVRASAVRALGVVGGSDAQAALETRLETEDSPEIREAIQQSLTQMQP